MKKTLIPCPQCKKELEWDTNNAFRPFCCERCKLIDLGAWANEDYQIAAEINAQEDDFSTGMIEMETYLQSTNKRHTVH